MKKHPVLITVNSVLLYVSAFLLTTIIHESAHALIGVLWGSKPILHHNFVEHLGTSAIPTTGAVLIALAGPVISLFQGLVAGAVILSVQRIKLFHLLVLWLSVLGFNNFLGYLMTGPVADNGDIGKVWSLLEIPLYLQLIVAAAGAGLLLLVAYAMTKPFLRFAYEPEWISGGKARKEFSFKILILPWLIGSVIMTGLYLPIVAVISIAYPIMSGFVFIFPWQNARRIEDVRTSDDDRLGKLSIPALVGFLALALFFRWVLAPGVAFG